MYHLQEGTMCKFHWHKNDTFVQEDLALLTPRAWTD